MDYGVKIAQRRHRTNFIIPLITVHEIIMETA